MHFDTPIMGTRTHSNFDVQLAVATDTSVKSEAILSAPASASGIFNGLEARRRPVMNNLGYAIRLVSWTYFQSALLPPLRPGLDPADIVKRLVQAGHIKVDRDTDERRWARFQDDPSDSKDFENAVFKNFERVADAVRETAQVVLQQWIKAQPAAQRPTIIDTRPTTIFKCNADMTSLFSLRFNTSKPDSFARLNPGTPFALPGTLTNDSILWDDIVVPGEFKKNSGWKEINDVSLCVFLTYCAC